jgi:hypothetical protein
MHLQRRLLKTRITSILVILSAFALPYAGHCQSFLSTKLSLQNGSSAQEVAQVFYDFNGKIAIQGFGHFLLRPQKHYDFDLTFSYENYGEPGGKVTQADYKRKNWRIRPLSQGNDSHQNIQLSDSGGRVKISTLLNGPLNSLDTLRFELSDHRGQPLAILPFPYQILESEPSADLSASMQRTPDFQLFLIGEEPESGQQIFKKEIFWTANDPNIVDLEIDEDIRLRAVVQTTITLDGISRTIKTNANQDYGFDARFSWKENSDPNGTRPQLYARRMTATLKSIEPGASSRPSRSTTARARPEPTTRQRSSGQRQGGSVTETSGRERTIRVSPASATSGNKARSGKKIQSMHQLAIQISRDNAILGAFTYVVDLRFME